VQFFTQLLVAQYDNGELELVRMGINGAMLSRWINEHEHSRRSLSNGTVAGD
jgi:hypothetical protein